MLADHGTKKGIGRKRRNFIQKWSGCLRPLIVVPLVLIRPIEHLQNAVLYHNLIEEKERIVDVDEEARKKLARDLHDGPTQSVAAIAMRMSYIGKLYKKSPEQVPDEIKKVEDLARRTTSESCR